MRERRGTCRRRKGVKKGETVEANKEEGVKNLRRGRRGSMESERKMRR